MKRKRITFLAMLMLAVILLMSSSIQAAAKPGAVKLTKITAVDYNKINIKWKNLQMLQAILYITKKLETVNGLN